MKDPLDHKIDALLASRPLAPSDDFAASVLERAEAEAAPRRRPLGKLLAFALPAAAAVVLTFSLLQLDTTKPTPASTTAAATATPALTTAEAQELFLLEESLAALATVETTDFGGRAMLATLDALYLEI